jgi:hypothetical protein
MSDDKVKINAEEDGPGKDNAAPEDKPYSEEDFEELTNTFGKGVNKRKMLVTRGITLKQLYALGSDD